MGGKAKPPAPPDPVALANAQASANQQTAAQQQKLNMVGSVGPNGSVTWSADPNQPGGFTQTTSLNPDQQAIYDTANRLTLQQLGVVGNMAGQGLNTRGMTGLQTGADLSNLHPGQGIQNSFGQGQALKYGFDPGGQVQMSVGGDLEAARREAIDATWNQAKSRLDPMWQQMDERDQTRLANQGFSQNSEGYENARGDFSRARNDAYNQGLYSAVGAGQQAAQDQFGRQLGQGQFANAAQQQQYGQNMGQADFWNSVAGQEYGQNLGAAEFGNSAQQQGFGQQAQTAQLGQANAQINNAARAQDFSERMAQYQLPFQTAAMLQQFGNSVQMPQGIGYTPSQVGQTDVLGANALSQQQANANYQSRMQQQNGLMSGLFSLGAAALMPSDRRLKREIVKLGTRTDGLGVYEFSYANDNTRWVGVMADEVKRARPDLVLEDAEGIMSVNYAGLPALPWAA